LVGYEHVNDENDGLKRLNASLETTNESLKLNLTNLQGDLKKLLQDADFYKLEVSIFSCFISG
jgi:hypothetical protein